MAGERTGGTEQAKRYASFVVQGWPRGASGTLEVAHEQSGERIKATTLTEAITWMQTQSGTAGAAGACGCEGWG